MTDCPQSPIVELEKTLDAQYKRLSEAWEKFQKVYEKSTKLKVDGKVPSRNAVMAAINKQQERLEQSNNSAMGKLRNGFRKICSQVKSHDNMVRVIPKDDKYFSLFMGALFSITEVSLTTNIGLLP